MSGAPAPSAIVSVASVPETETALIQEALEPDPQTQLIEVRVTRVLHGLQEGDITMPRGFPASPISPVLEAPVAGLGHAFVGPHEPEYVSPRIHGGDA